MDSTNHRLIQMVQIRGEAGIHDDKVQEILTELQEIRKVIKFLKQNLSDERVDLKSEISELQGVLQVKDSRITSLKEEKNMRIREIEFLRQENSELARKMMDIDKQNHNDFNELESEEDDYQNNSLGDILEIPYETKGIYEGCQVKQV